MRKTAIFLVLAGLAVALWWSSRTAPEASVAPEAAPADPIQTAPTVAAALETARAPGSAVPQLSPDAVARLLAGGRKPSDAQLQVARDFGALYAAWSDARHAALFVRPTPEHNAALSERVEWFRQKLGECGEGQPASVRDGERASFVYACGRGTLEATFTLDPESLRVDSIAIGARDTEPEPAVLAAAQSIAALERAWDPALYQRTFAEKYEADKVRTFLAGVLASRGPCRLGEADRVSARGGIFALHCEHAERLLKVELDDHDLVGAYAIWPPRDAE